MKVGIVGATGRMGKEVISLLNENEFCGGICKKTTSEEIENIVKNSSVMIDFSSPKISIEVVNICAKNKIPFVCGTTGFSKNDFEKLKMYSKNIPILYASNFSIGIFLMSQLIKTSEKILNDFDISIIDRHHNKKKDGPSGTTLFLASQLEKNPQIVSIRAGGIPGDHICSFTSDDEEITISHRSFNRRVFASGAVKCARWIVSREPGFYSLKDYLDEEK